VQLGRKRVLEPAQRAATVVQANPMRKSRPGKSVDLQDVVQEFDQLEGPRATSLTSSVCSIASKLSRTWWTQLPDGETT